MPNATHKNLIEHVSKRTLSLAAVPKVWLKDVVPNT